MSTDTSFKGTFMFVQFSDDTKQKIVSVFAAPQDTEAFPNQGEVTEDDPRLAEFLSPEGNVERQAATLRARRDTELAATDWTQLPDVPKETKAKFVPYRAALRDVPQQVGFPSDVKWPATPQ